MRKRSFDPATFYVEVQATPKECGALRQDLVRSLKDYFEMKYGFDKYGAETIFLLSDQLAHPYVYGFAAQRILRDRRIREQTKVYVARRSLNVLDYGTDLGMPYGLYTALLFLARSGNLTTDDLRYALVASAGETAPFNGMEKEDTLGFLDLIINRTDMTSQERLFWCHSLLARHGDGPAATDLINALLMSARFSLDERVELCRAWIHQRQPRLEVPVPIGPPGLRSDIVIEHMPFWLSHSSSLSGAQMVTLGLVWLARLTDKPEELLRDFLACPTAVSVHICNAIADVIAEHFHSMSRDAVLSVIEHGIAVSESSATRRRFYRLGLDMFGPHYLERASEDSANSVRQWAARQLLKQSS